MIVILNFSGETPIFKLPSDFESKGELLISNYDVIGDEDIREVKLRPYEARVYLMK
jgi:oligo-1,6-glucosidase